MPLKNPPHPGDFIRTEIIEPAGLSVTEAAKALLVSRPALSRLLNGKADLAGEMALRIEKSLRREDGHACADAIELRHCQDPQPRKGNQGRPALSPQRRPPTLKGERHRKARGEPKEYLSFGKWHIGRHIHGLMCVRQFVTRVRERGASLPLLRWSL